MTNTEKQKVVEIEELEEFRFMGLNYKQLRSAILFARQRGWDKMESEPIDKAIEVAGVYRDEVVKLRKELAEMKALARELLDALTQHEYFPKDKLALVRKAEKMLEDKQP
jgi:hypothetical protein